MEGSHGTTIVWNVQVIPAIEEAIGGMALGGIRRCCISLLELNSIFVQFFGYGSLRSLSKKHSDSERLHECISVHDGGA